MSTIERVEIYRSGSAEFSSQAMAGTINIILKKIPRAAQQQLKIGLSHDATTAPRFEWSTSDKKNNQLLIIRFRFLSIVFSSRNDSTDTEYNLQNKPIREARQSSSDENVMRNLFINPVLTLPEIKMASVSDQPAPFPPALRVHDQIKPLTSYWAPLYRYKNCLTKQFTLERWQYLCQNYDTFLDECKARPSLGINGGESSDHGNELNYANPKQLFLYAPYFIHQPQWRCQQYLKDHCT